VTDTVDALREAAHAATRPAAWRRTGLAVGAFVGSQTVVHTTGPVNGDSLFHGSGAGRRRRSRGAHPGHPADGRAAEDTGPQAGAPITLGQLATHTSGLPRLPPACCCGLWVTVPTPIAT
jgi:hypothetical protein